MPGTFFRVPAIPHCVCRCELGSGTRQKTVRETFFLFRFSDLIAAAIGALVNALPSRR